jgi:hypothetical protein
MREAGAWEEPKMNTASDWLFNVMLLGAIVALLVLTFEVFVGPILNGLTVLVGLVLVVVVAALWPQW